MSKTRDNHYVPEWHQKGFYADGKTQLRYLGIVPKKIITLPNGKTKSIFTNRWRHPSQCFYQTDLYTTFFGKYINDDIERKLFGEIDETGSRAVRAFIGEDFVLQHKNFENFFTYLDAQKIRTPKGLDWIKHNYPDLHQLELMEEMQAIRAMHCTLWTEGVREIVSAKDSDVKFIVSDHPITIYNHACPPDTDLCTYPNDPDIALKASQTIYPLDKDHALILTNLEYALNPDGCDPLEQRTYAQKVRLSLTRTDAFIRTRSLNSDEVTKINYIIKRRARQFIAAGKDEWLYPEKDIQCCWDKLRDVLLPPPDQMYQFGGETFASYEDGSTYYQDAFGRTTRQHDFLTKTIDESTIKPNDICGCGSGNKYKKCCRNVPLDQRTTWKVRSIRERNLSLYRAIYQILGLEKGKTWDDVRLTISDEQIRDIYGVYSVLWPIETDIYELLPKPDGKFRGLYTGFIDPRTIGEFALGMSPYFDELLIHHPFVNPNNLKPKFGPVESPSSYKYQALKDIWFFLSLESFVKSGLISLIPDPCYFDNHLQHQMLDMSDHRRDNFNISARDQEIAFRLQQESLFHMINPLSDHMKAKEIRQLLPDLNDAEVQDAIKLLNQLAQYDPLALLKDPELENGSQFCMFNMSPNYEMALFIAQATGSVIITDSESRWNELQQAQHREQGFAVYPWQRLSKAIGNLSMCTTPNTIFDSSKKGEVTSLRRLLGELNTMVRADSEDVDKISELEQRLITAMDKVIDLYDSEEVSRVKIKALIPKGGFADRYIQRLLIKSNCQTYMNSVSMVMYVEHEN